MRGADLQYAVLYGFDLSKAHLDGADLSHAALLPPTKTTHNCPSRSGFSSAQRRTSDKGADGTGCSDYDFPDLKYSAATLVTEQNWDHLRLVLELLFKLTRNVSTLRKASRRRIACDKRGISAADRSGCR